MLGGLELRHGSVSGGGGAKTHVQGGDSRAASCERHFAKPFRRIHSRLMAICSQIFSGNRVLMCW